MTLVARLLVNRSPLLMGDLLLSGNEVPGQFVNVPTIGSISSVFPEGSLRVPRSMRQKIAVVSDNLLVGWAGGRSAAGSVIRELIEKEREKPFTLDSLEHYLKNLHKSVWEQCGFAGFIKNEHELSYFGFNSLELQTKSSGVAGLLGTGSDQVAQFLQNFPGGHAIGTKEPNELGRALAYGLSISGSFLSLEIASRESLLNYFGAGYEIASLIDGKFQKLDNVTYVFWYGQMTDDGFGADLHQVCKYSYINDVLAIRTETLSASNNETYQTKDRSLYAVLPVYRDLTQTESTDLPQLVSRPPSFDSKWLCNYFFLWEPTGGVAIFSLVHHCGEKEPPIRFFEEENRLVVAFEKNFTDTMLKHAYDTYNVSLRGPN